MYRLYTPNEVRYKFNCDLEAFCPQQDFDRGFTLGQLMSSPTSPLSISSRILIPNGIKLRPVISPPMSYKDDVQMGIVRKTPTDR